MLGLELLFGLGALVLLGAIVWGYTRNKHRNRANDAVTEAATRDEYDNPETYQQDEQGFRDQIRPS